MTRKEKYRPTLLTDPDEYIARDEERETIGIEYRKEREFLSRKYGVKNSQISLDLHHPVGEVCIFIDGKWAGYIDEEFAYCMENDIDPREYEAEKWKDDDAI